ncbi:MFS transporter [Gordonia polyisoprenivorans]|uniref:MFS transporter n=1 Tax=Gordonia polyisoprenivorans TaxID=84595 RepID=UPI0013149DAD|nr:MFS transporter [Gordonia polyisoprenivorans]
MSKTEVRTDDSAPPTVRHWRRNVVAAVAGNVIEYADFAMWSAFTIYFATQFFPTENRTAQLMYGAGIFAVGQIARPLGALFFGRLADRRGRRLALTASVTLMGLASVAMAAAPTYETAGMSGAIILLVARIVQGLSVGGEHGAAAAYIVESAPKSRRGLASSGQYIGVMAGSILAALIMVVSQIWLSETQMEQWGWRVAFAAMGLVAVGAFVIRTRMTETEEFTREQRRVEQEQAQPDAVVVDRRGSLAVLWDHRNALVFVFVLGSATTLLFQTFASYSITYLVDTVGMSRPDAAMVRLVGLFAPIIALPIFGLLSDRIGRRPLLIGGFAGSALLTIPIFIGYSPDPAWSVLLYAVGLIPVAAALSVMALVSASAFPTSVRTLGVSLPYALAIAVVGGSSEFLALAFRTAGWDAAYFGYAIMWAVLGLVVSIRSRHAEPGTLDGSTADIRTPDDAEEVGRLPR